MAPILADGAPRRGFPAEEFDARTLRAQSAMHHHDLAGLLLTTEAELRYFTGFHTLFWQSPTRPWFLFLPAVGKPIAVIPEIGAALMAKTWVEDIRTWPAPRPEDDGLSLLVDLLTPLAKTKARLGTLKGHETQLRMPLGDYERLIAGLPGIEIVDATEIIRGLRMIKSPREIEKLTHICQIGGATFAAVPQIAQVGAPLDRVFREVRRSALALGADTVPYLVGGAAQGGYDDVISPPSARALETGDILMLDTGAEWDGYFCDFDRNWSVGPAPDAARDAYDVLWQATQAGIEAVRPGMTCSDLFEVMQKVTATKDPTGGDVGRFGHGLGMQLTEWPSLASFDETVIEEGMVLTLEPSLTFGPSQMMVHEENLVVHAGGAALLSPRAPQTLPEI